MLDLISVNKSCRRQSTYFLRGQWWEVETYPGVGAMTCHEAKEFCRARGGYLPILKTNKAVKAVRFAFCNLS